ncbi:SMP-30/gluconolactonase/LRE family protein [Primorskyibacter sp. S187A]|uniref:SMP-30/gluconolactonase/LRE family protein n=1 Tax=Primorskyibacter sp. S187A TaxID=3415130 RepID=UPI003C7BE5B3
MAFDDRICALGEGPLWHPERAQFFWFDILGKRLLTPGAEWQFDEYVSAAGWIDHDHLLIASSSALIRFNLETRASDIVAPLEADTPGTRSNDGRADPQGGFWIGTMSVAAEDDGAGAIYRYYRGTLRRIFERISIPNSTCFAPNGRTAYFADTPKGVIWRVGLDAHGWPEGAREVHVDLRDAGLNPDGAVVDHTGTLWVACWGAAQVVGYGPDGRETGRFDLPAPQTTCPAFGGPELSQMLVTSATQGLDSSALVAAPSSGKTFLLNTDLRGQPEHQVIL